MKIIKDYFENKTLNDLKRTIIHTSQSNEITLNNSIIEQVVTKLRAGEDYKTIKRSVITLVGQAKMTLSYRQIKQIDIEWKSKLSELQTP